MRVQEAVRRLGDPMAVRLLDIGAHRAALQVLGASRQLASYNKLQGTLVRGELRRRAEASGSPSADASASPASAVRPPQASLEDYATGAPPSTCACGKQPRAFRKLLSLQLEATRVRVCAARKQADTSTLPVSREALCTAVRHTLNVLSLHFKLVLQDDSLATLPPPLPLSGPIRTLPGHLLASARQQPASVWIELLFETTRMDSWCVPAPPAHACERPARRATHAHHACTGRSRARRSAAS